jgi:hypothetical protein
MFVQVIQGSVADVDELRACLDRWTRDLAPGATGWLGSTSGVTADGRSIAVVRFESEDAARANSERPEQHQWWMETSKLFAGDITFHDSRDVYDFGRGGSDDAGFVQVIQGKTKDVEKARSLETTSQDQMRAMRPDVIGGIVAWHPQNGRYTNAIYFTSEAEARAKERESSSSPEFQKYMQEWQALADGEPKFLDITQPWYSST